MLIIFLLANLIILFLKIFIKSIIIKKDEKYKTIYICSNSINNDFIYSIFNCFNIRKL